MVIMYLQWVFILAGIAGLYAGAELLVRGASGVAKGLDVRPALIGLTLVAFGTSAPELTVTLLATIRGSSDIVLGNIIGSNIANIGLVIGVAALIHPLSVDRKIIRHEVVVAIIAVFVFFLMSLDGQLGRIDGTILLFGMAVCFCLAVRRAIRERAEIRGGELPKPPGKVVVSLILMVAGIAVVVGGGHIFLKAAVFVARTYGISEFFIAVTMIALGTSLPELATSAVASLRRKDDLCIANVIGSNIMNILLVIGLAAAISPIAVDRRLLTNEFLFLIGFSLLLLPLLRTGFRINRLEGAFCILAYAVFIYFAYSG